MLLQFGLFAYCDLYPVFITLRVTSVLSLQDELSLLIMVIIMVFAVVAYRSVVKLWLSMVPLVIIRCGVSPGCTMWVV